jgi:hypothetical protein
MACSLKDQKIADLEEMKQLFEVEVKDVLKLFKPNQTLKYDIQDNVINIYQNINFNKNAINLIANQFESKITSWAAKTSGSKFQKGWVSVNKGFYDKISMELSVPNIIEKARLGIINEIDIAETLAEMNSLQFIEEVMALDNSATNQLLKEQEALNLREIENEFVENEKPVEMPTGQLTLDFDFDESKQTTNKMPDLKNMDNIIKKRNKNC